ncbi:MAG: insulinase family protein [Clostridiaceae bacterium]|nr:insulinase family protein [Clostridiaceae bacterium]MBW4859770.1 insulinase family protein [Clostridiaceae bacterium]MBW4869800.1 insulinase family protein [Clostridiaceae bacterium]
MAISNERLNIGNGINLNLIKTDKFKSNLVSLYMEMPLNRDMVTQNALIPLVLKRGTNKYNTTLEVERKLEELYGGQLSLNINKKGERHVLRFTIESPKGFYVDDEEYFYEVISFLKEIVYNPYVDDGGFKKEYVDQEKENLKRMIEGKINDKRSYAMTRCIEEMCKNEKYSIYEYGYVKDLDFIDNKNLYEHYKSILENSPIEIFYIGNYDNKMIDHIKNTFKIDRENITKIPREKITDAVQTKNMVYEDMQINQGKLVIGYRTGIPYEDNLYKALLVSSEILGGGPNSKLFRTVREKESLAYYINSKIYKYKSIMIIDAGIDFDKFEKTLEITRNQIDELKEGIFTDDDIEIAKKAIVTSLKSVTDSNYLISEFFLSQVLSNDNRSVDEMIEDILNVNREDIIEVANKINVDTIYFLKNENL